MKMKYWFVGAFSTLLAVSQFSELGSSSGSANGAVARSYQDSSDQPAADEGNSKALKYHSALRRRPTPGYLYDRFYLAWLETSSIDQLEEFLVRQAEDNPSHGDRLLLAFFYEKQGREVDSLKQFRLALAEDPGNAETLLEKAKVEARTLDFETALSDLSQAAASDPKSEVAIEIAQLHAKLLLRSRQTEAATKVLGDLLSRFGDDQRLVEDVVELQVEEGQYESALSTLEDLIGKTTDPYQKVMRQLRQGDVLQLSGKREEALSQYAATLSQSGRESWLEREILAQIEQLFVREDNIEGLVTFYEGLLEKEPQRLALNKAVSGLKLQLGDVDGALEQFGRVVEMTPGDRSNREAYIDLLVKADRLDSAVEQLKSLLQQQGDAELNLKLAELQKQTGAEGSVVESTLREYLRASGETEFAYQRAARQATSLELIDLSVSLHRENVERHPDSLTARENLASVLYEQEKKEEALGIWRELAGAGDANQLARVGRILSTRREHQAAYDLLVSQQELVNENAGLLNLLCRESIALKQYTPAVEWVLRLVELSETSSDLDGSLVLALQVIDKADQLKSLSGELADKSDRTVNQTCLLSELYEQQGDPLRANRLLSERVSVAEAANDLPALQKLAMQQVRLLSSRQNWEEAAAAMNKLLKVPGAQNANAIKTLVDLYQRAGDLEAAVKAVDQWKQVAVSSVTPWMVESTLLQKMGREEEALVRLRSATQKFPDDETLFGRLGDLYMEGGKYREAERLFWLRYEESKELSGKLRWAERLASVAEETGEIDELVNQLEQRRRTNPQAVEPVLALSQVHRVNDNYEGRRSALLEAVRLQPENTGLLQEIARIENEEGDWEQAIETLQKALEIKPSSDIRRQLAGVYLEYGEADKGYNQLLQSIGGNQANPREIEQLVSSMIQLQDWEMAQQFLQEYISGLDSEPDYRLQYLMGMIQVELEQFEPAIESFVQLLSPQEEILGLPSQSFFMPWDANEMTGLPSAIKDLMEMYFLNDQVFSYREDGGGFGYGSYYYGGSGSNSLPLPGTFEQCRLMAICFLKDISLNLEQEQVASLQQRLKSIGILSPELMLDPSFDLDMVQGDSLAEFREKYPENDGLLGLEVLNSLSLNRVSGDLVPTLELALERFPESERTIRLVAATGLCAQEPEKYSELLEQYLDEFDGRELTAFEIQMLVAATMTERDEMVSLPDEITSRMRGLMVKSAGKLLEVAPYMFDSLLSQLQRDDPQAWLKMLDQQAGEELGQAGGSVAAMMQRQMMMSEGVSFSPPRFPPQQWNDLNATVANQVFAEDESSYSPFSDDQELLTPEEWLEKIGNQLDVVTDPFLSVCLQIKKKECELASEAEGSERSKQLYQAGKTLLKPMTEGEAPRLDAFSMLAGLAAEAEEWEAASETLEKARALPMSRDMRLQIDSHLAGLGLLAASEEEKPEELMASARAAAMRLQRSNLPHEQRLQLVTAFSDLGLTDEAEQLEDKLAGQSSSAGMSYMSNPYGRSSGSSTERLRDLVAEGKTDAAVRLLQTELTSLATQAVSLDYQMYIDDELKQFETTVGALKLEKELLEKLNPGETTAARKWIAYGLAQELFGENETAIATYRRALRGRSNEEGTRLRIINLSLDEGAERVLEELKTVPEKSWERFVDALVRTASDQDLEQQLVIGTALAEYLRSEPETEYFDWAANFVETLAADQALSERSNLHRGSLYVKDSASELKQKFEDAKPESAYRRLLSKRMELLEQRRQLHSSLCREMLKIPATSQFAFSALLGASRANEESEVKEDWFELARQALLLGGEEVEQDQMSASPMSYAFGNVYWNEPDFDDDAPAVSPLQYFVERCAELDNGMEVGNSLVAELSEAGAKALADRLQTELELSFLPEVDYATKASQLFAQNQDIAEATTYLNTIVTIWNRRELTVSLDDLLLQASSAEGKNRREVNYHPVVASKYAIGLFVRGKVEESLTFRDRYIEQMVGDLFEKEDWERESRRGGSTRQRQLQALDEFASQMFNNEDCVDLCVSTARKMHMDQKLSYLVERLMWQSGNEKERAGRLVPILATMGCLDPLDSFDPVFVPGEEDESIFASVVQRLEYEEELAKELLAKLDGRKATFGSKLLKGYLDQDLDGIYSAVGEEKESFSQLAPDRQEAIAKIVNRLSQRILYSAANVSKDSSEDAIDGKSLLADVLSKHIGQQLDTLLKARYLHDLPVEEYNASDWILAVIKNIDRDDVESAVAAIDKAKELLKDDRNNAGTTANLIHALLKEKDIEDLKLFLQLAARESFAMDDLLGDNTRGTLAEIIAGQLKGESSILVNSPQAWSGLVNECRRNEIPDTAFVLLLTPAFASSLDSATEEELEMLNAWISEELAAEPGNHWYQALALATTACKGRRQWKEKYQDQLGRMEFPGLASEVNEENKLLTELLDSDELTLSVKRELARVAIINSFEMPADSVASCLRVYKQQMQEDGPPEGNASVFVFKRAGQLVGMDSQRELIQSIADLEVEGLRESDDRWQYSNSGLDVALIDLLHTLGDTSGINRLPRGDRDGYSFIGHDGRVRLVELGHYDIEKRLPGIALDEVQHLQKEKLFTKQLEASIPGMEEVYSKPEERLLNKLAFSALENTAREGEIPETTAQQRVGGLVDEYLATEFRGEGAKTIAAYLFVAKGVFGEPLLQKLRELTENVDAENLSLLSVGEDEQRMFRGAVRAVAEFEIGDPEFFVAYVSHLASLENSYEAESALQDLWQLGKSLVLEDFQKLTDQQQSTLLESLRDSSVRELFPISFALHHAYGKKAEWQEWLEAHPDESRYFDLDDAWSEVYLAIKDSKNQSEDMRLELVKDLWEVANQGAVTIGSGHFTDGVQQSCIGCSSVAMGLDAIVDSKLLSAAELAKIADQLAEIESVDGEIWRQVGKIQVKEKNLEAAKAAYEKALEATKESMEQARVNRTLEYAHVLYLMGEAEAAREKVKDLDQVQLFGDNPERLKEILK